MTHEYAGFLAHYGVKGQKWGVRNWQNEDGTYSEEGKHHYGWGYGRQPRIMAPRGGIPAARRLKYSVDREGQRQAINQRSLMTKEEMEIRKAKTRRIIAAGAVISLATILAARKGGSLIQNKMKSRFVENHMNSVSPYLKDNKVIREFAERNAAEKYNTRWKAVSTLLKKRRWG